ncbi:oligopeptide transport system permease protein [Sinobacterium caligoides]|uniref:Oligopeptide transport system permease protein n=1 Tax=Sinobacterium caligoides TaxID=933926 RepID=A0A3N2DNV7_9GAMM|nr:ABC transporter permease [Sinobacterium caligoides]ROS01470.1 oligopeptide transport system permease protein [Sinobacterium caligoides]
MAFVNSSKDLTAADFAPLLQRDSGHEVVRPSLSYWQDAWRRLIANRSAAVSLWVVIGLMVFTLAGPSLIGVDPSSQDLSQISRGPSWQPKAELVNDTVAYTPVVAVPRGSPQPGVAPTGFTLIKPANTESIQLQWQPVAGSEGYAIYRHEYQPHGRHDLGVPLAEVAGAENVSYLDGLKLESIRYYYSVVAIFDGVEAEKYTTLAVDVEQAITYADAVRYGLIEPGDTSAIGTEITMHSHLLGTDYLGRDMLVRLMVGAQTSLFIGVISPLLFVGLGLVYGGIAGYVGGKTDEVMMRFVDFVIALPFLLFMILFKVGFGIGPGESGIMPMLIALVLLSWPSTARLVRGQVLQIREEPYVQAAMLMGARPSYLIFRHMLPNVMGVLLVSLTFAIPSAIFTEAFLSFIGMGVSPPTPSWGSMCNDGMRTMLTHPHELLFPAAIIGITVMAFNLLGDGLRDALDVKMRGQK